MTSDFEPNELYLAIKTQAVLASRFDLEEFKTLCFRLGINFDNLRAEGLDGKARELTAYFQRRKQLVSLVNAIRQYRPDIDI